MLPQLETPRMLLREVAIGDGPALQAFQARRPMGAARRWSARNSPTAPCA